MITLYTGTPGSGKSLHVIQVILKALRWKKQVIANFPIKFNTKESKKGYEERFHYYTNENITVESLIDFALNNGLIEKAKESQCLVVIDEAGGRFNVRDFNKKERAAWIDFFSQHRKLGYDFILVAQNDRMIDRQIRGYVEIEKKHRKVNNYSFFQLLPFIKIFVSIEHWYTAKQRVSSELFLYRKEYGERYDTMKMFDGFILSEEMMRKINLKRGIEVGEQNPLITESIDVIYVEETTNNGSE